MNDDPGPLSAPSGPDAAARLAAMRAEIDAIDENLIALISQRNALASEMARIKPPDSSPLRPAREAQILRRLIDLAPPHVEPGLIIALWRTLIAANLARQAAYAVIAAGGLDPVRQVDLARRHFGPDAAIVREADVRVAVTRAADARDTFVVTPWPSASGPGMWWPMLTESRLAGVAVVAALPAFGGPPEAALVAKGVALEASGAGDRTLLLGYDRQHRSARILSTAGVTGKETARANDAVLIVADGFIAPDSPGIAALRQAGLDGARVVGTFSQL